MSSYIIAGSADKPEVGYCETIANKIKSYYQNIDFRIIIKHPKEWENYIHEILRIYGFKKKFDPIVFTLDGKLIGGIEGFKELAETAFGIENINNLQNDITPDINMKIVKKEVEAKKKLQKGKKTLEEKIFASLKEKFNDENIQAVGGIYESYIQSGVQLYVKQLEKICPDIYINDNYHLPVEREIITKAKLDIVQIAQGDNFVQETLQDDNASHNPEISQNNQDQVIDTARSKQEGNLNKSNVQQEQEAQQENQQEEQLQVQDEEKQNQNINLETEEEKINQQQNQEDDEQNQQIQENENQEKDDQSQVENEDLLNQADREKLPVKINLAKTLVKSMKDDYYLAFHPNPTLNGQIILFEQFEDENSDSEQEQSDLDGTHVPVYIQDWSKTLKDRKIKKKFKSKEQNKDTQKSDQDQDQDQDQEQEQQQQVQNEEENQNDVSGEQNKEQKKKFKSKLNRGVVELQQPLSKHDWQKIKIILKKLQCLITLQILPFGCCSHQALSNNTINIYLRKFLNNVSHNQGLSQVLESYFKNEQELDEQYIPFEKYILDLKGQADNLETVEEDYIKVPSLEFEHLIYTFDKEIEEEDLKQRFKQMINIIYTEEEILKNGLNLIVTSKFMMVVPLRGSYGYFQDIPLFLEPLSYMGYLHLPVLSKVWPTTAYEIKNETNQQQFIQLLNNQILNKMDQEKQQSECDE